MPQREAMTDEQVAKRRKIERLSQRNSRAKTKARVRDLERVIESLQASDRDERLESTMALLIQNQEHGRKMQGFLKDLQRLLNENQQLWSEEGPKTKAVDRDSTFMPRERPDDGNGIVTQQPSPPRPVMDLESPLNSNIGRCIRDNVLGDVSATRSVPIWRSVDMALERAVEYVGETGQFFQHRKDMDIAVRAIVDGWTNVRTVHAGLEVDWLTLKEVDQTLFCDCSPPTRLAILLALRLNTLKLAGCADTESLFPPFYRKSPAQQMIQHPVLLDFFPWPNLRDCLILSPSLYQSVEFPSHFSKNVHFLWPSSITDAYRVDHDRYALTPAFDASFRDIGRWTLSSDFFAHYPELIGFVPMHDALPPSMDIPDHASGYEPFGQHVTIPDGEATERATEFHGTAQAGSFFTFGTTDLAT